ncbi:MAG: BCCT family transporter [Pseudomonadota bacterium]
MKIKPIVFFPPFVCFALALLQSFGRGQQFFEQLILLQEWLLSHLGNVFTWGTFLMFVACVAAYFSPLGKIKIGGAEAVPILDKWRWFAVALCTTVAVGALFWGTAEPLFHFHEPSLWLKSTAEKDKIYFAISSLFLHWSLTPYAIYTVPTIVFALMYYNSKKTFSLAAPLSPLFGDRLKGKAGEIIDSICLFSLVAGMSASLGTGVLTLSGGIRKLLPIDNSLWLLGGILLTIVAAFVISAVTGITRGIRLLSEINASVFVVLALLILIVGPTSFIFRTGFDSLGMYFSDFVSRSLYLGEARQVDPWVKSWTLFYWCNWLAWAPVTALFLGRISYGDTVREVIITNLVLPSLFAWVWMAIFGGWAVHSDLQTSGQIFKVIQTQGVEAALYALIGKLSIAEGLKAVCTILVIVTAFLAYVTSAEANTSAMAAISTKGISPENPEAPTSIKILWGICVGLAAGVMVSGQGIKGIKTLSVLGGVPSLFLVLLILGSLLKLIFKWKTIRT